MFFKNGISPREFRRNRLKDIIDCIDLDNAINNKNMRQAKINEMMSKIR